MENTINAIEYQKIYSWISSHEQEIKDKIVHESESGAYPHDCIDSYELEMDIEGHDVYWKFEYITDRDGGEYDGNNEFEIDGENMFLAPLDSLVWDIDQFLSDLVLYD